MWIGGKKFPTGKLGPCFWKNKNKCQIARRTGVHTWCWPKNIHFNRSPSSMSPFPGDSLSRIPLGNHWSGVVDRPQAWYKADATCLLIKAENVIGAQRASERARDRFWPQGWGKALWKKRQWAWSWNAGKIPEGGKWQCEGFLIHIFPSKKKKKSERRRRGTVSGECG